MSVSKTNEQAFEALIERALVGSTIEERGAEADVKSQNPGPGKYYWGKPEDMDKKLAIDLHRLWSFLESTQADILAEYKGGDLKKDVPYQISKMIETIGIVNVLRNGIDVANIHLTLIYPRPTAADSEASKEKYSQNQFSITRQQTFSIANPGLEIDMVLFVNGLPIFTFELKNPWTHQTAKYDGQKQYQSKERNPKETLLNYGRCLAHFTLDKNEIYFTTRLNLEKTWFMPFNQGLPNGQGAGNPIPADGRGYKTGYLWEQVLKKDSVTDIIMNYVLFDYDEAKTQKKVPHIMRNAKKLIFPRYHQLDVVNKLIDDVAELGVGKTYLIQHSAGSGKSNSLTWLSFKLIRVCPNSMDAVRAKGTDTPLFNSVIVVTDRRLLDKQITDNIKAFGQSEKIIAHANSSRELKEAIEQNKRIIITTIQKFPFICDSISDVSDHNFAIVIDEAHSSQSGIAADKTNAALQKSKDNGEEDTDSLLDRLMLDRKMSTNCSYFAFTATPKKETLERFGWKDADGKYHPFHLYSMKQAIEEEFILDVLNGYTTFKSYYELKKSIDENPEFNNEKAQKALRRLVERDPKTIEAKAEIMLSHFDSKMFRNHKLKGKAKAMVVTKDIECAILYYQALKKIAEEKKMPFGILVSFTPKTIKGIDYTESDMNGFPESQTPEKFDSDDFRILVVANKYTTGFDQPKLCAMYVDKPLAGVLAVQTLSRLNRAAHDLGKRSEDLFILDFYNTTEDIKEAFGQFYTDLELTEATDVNILHELKSTLLSIGVFDMDEVNRFIDLYVHGAEADQWAPIIDTCANRANNEIEWTENGQADFKMKCKQFEKIYRKAAAIMDYEVRDWEKLFWFFRFLIPELNVPGAKTVIKDLYDYVDLNTYGLRRTALNETIVLDAGKTQVEPNKATMVSAGPVEDEKDPLDKILKDFNEKWFKGWDATPDDQKAKIISITKAVVANEDYQDFVVGNPDQEAVEKKMAQIIDKVMSEKRRGDQSLYKQYRHNPTFKEHFMKVISRLIEDQETLAYGENNNGSKQEL